MGTDSMGFTHVGLMGNYRKISTECLKLQHTKNQNLKTSKLLALKLWLMRGARRFSLHFPTYISDQSLRQSFPFSFPEPHADPFLLDNTPQYAFLGFVREAKDRPMMEITLMEGMQNQYMTRHLPDGRIIFSDQRISSVLGYLPSEVMGESAFSYIRPEDIPWTAMAQRHSKCVKREDSVPVHISYLFT